MELKGITILVLCMSVCISVGYARAPSKIVNGRDAFVGQFPHQVSLQYYTYDHICGGTILDATHILTAAHCVVSDEFKVERPANIHVLAGVNNNRIRNDANIFLVSKIIPHAFYSVDPILHDIAILKLAREIPFNDVQKPISLPTRDTPASSPAITSGWGHVNNKGRTIKDLQQLEMVVVSQAECARYYGAESIWPGHICVRGPPGAGSCSGDSGSPLTSTDGVIGVNSFGLQKCGIEHPDVFTRVYPYVQWIKDVIRRTP